MILIGQEQIRLHQHVEQDQIGITQQEQVGYSILFWLIKIISVLEMNIWNYWTESNSWIYFYIILINKNWKMYWSEQSFAEDDVIEYNWNCLINIYNRIIACKFTKVKHALIVNLTHSVNIGGGGE